MTGLEQHVQSLLRSSLRLLHGGDRAAYLLHLRSKQISGLDSQRFVINRCKARHPCMTPVPTTQRARTTTRMTRHSATQMPSPGAATNRERMELHIGCANNRTTPPARATTHEPHESTNRNSPTRTLHDRHPTTAQDHGHRARATNNTREILPIDLRVHIAPLPPMLPIWIASIGAPSVRLTIEHERSGAESAV